MISPQTIQQITNRIDIIDVIGEFIKLKKRGANYLGLCPFHGEKSPSFTVSPAKEIYKCFGCGKSGNTISFLMDHEHISYVEALRWLANRYNIEIEETEVSDEVREARQLSESLFIANQYAQKFFTEQLKETEEGNDIAMSYLYERGFTDDIIEKFQIGYNPQDRDIFFREAVKNQYNPDILLKTGLVTQRYGDAYVDNYRGRIIFPVHNPTGKILGFGARVIGKPPANAPKYINTPENEIYVKSKILYGIYFSRQAIDRQDECYLVEGYTDVISLYQAGVENVVSSGGTSLTQDQLRLIQKYTNNLTIIYDGDAAGIKAALRGIDMAIEQGLNVHLVLIPDKEDPDSYVKKVGAEDFRAFVNENKKDIILFQLDVMMKDAGSDLNKKNEVVNHIAETLSKIDKTEDFTKQQDYIRKCSELLKIDEGGLTTLVNKYKRDKYLKEERRYEQKGSEAQEEEVAMPGLDSEIVLSNKDFNQEKNLIRVLLEYGLNEWENNVSVASFIEEQVETFGWENVGFEELFNVYIQEYNAGKEPTVKTLLYYPNDNINKTIVDATLFPYELSSRFTEKQGVSLTPQATDVWREDVNKTVIFYKIRKIKNLLQEAESALQKDQSFDEQIIIMKVYKQLKDQEDFLSKQIGSVIIK
ncbi:DNA primase [Rhizosphaericola mali]|uniref:DNA primase n=1 Tax=Rhizosphaericola mali TaxID=2545455 RepID=A0A5P2G8Q0_9BACT|nr:DNA primase [Rhizosphaericola mali]QES89593.1 DNA primase [Rhizosphaericola mali]